MNARRESWADGYVDEVTGEYVLPASRSVGSARSTGRTTAPKRVAPIADSSLDRFVLETQARARADSQRFGRIAIRCAFWAVIALGASWWLGWICWIASVGLGAAALWYAQRGWIEKRIGNGA